MFDILLQKRRENIATPSEYIFVLVDEVLIKKIKILVQDFRDEDPHVQVGMIMYPNIPLENVNPCRLKIFFWPIE